MKIIDERVGLIAFESLNCGNVFERIKNNGVYMKMQAMLNSSNVVNLNNGIVFQIAEGEEVKLLNTELIIK